jgi:streptomycin 6-kinase
VDEALRGLARRWELYWPAADADVVAADVSARMGAAASAWGLNNLEPLQGGVVALTAGAGDVVVKVLPRRHPEEAVMRGEGAALAHWADTDAAVDLVDARDDGMTLLLRRLRPASRLDDLPYDEQLAVVGDLVARLHAAGEPPASLPAMDEHVAVYAETGDIAELIETADRHVAVHADLHGSNVLLDGRRWVAIDPKGVRGDPHLDIWLLLCPQAPPLPEDDPASEAWRRVRLYSDAARLDPERAAAWVRAIARAEAKLGAYSAYVGWIAKLRRFAAALS